MNHRVRIGTCSGPAEAAFVRSVFDAHEIPVVINGEQHASVLGGLGGFVRLDILVDGEDAEEASALLADIRAGEHAVAEDEVPENVVDDDASADAAGVWAAQEPAIADGAAPAGIDSRRRKTGAILLLSVLAGFGTAHMSTGAWLRGVVIAIANVVGIWLAATGDRSGGWILFGARFVDLFGALVRVWSRPAG